MKYKLLIFDMDGTILNTLDDLKNSTNYVLRKAGMPERSLEEVRRFVGNGIRRLLEQAVTEGTSADELNRIHRDFMEHYQLHCADLTRPYEGIIELLQKVKELGYKTAVVSNKADTAVQELCEQYFKGLFDCSLGERSGIARKPAPDMVNLVLNTLSIEKKEAVYIGDSEVDIATAVNSGLDVIAVEWGFRDKKFLQKNGAEIMVSAPLELINYI